MNNPYEENNLDSCVSIPPRGVTYALPYSDLTPLVKHRVGDLIVNSDWSKYYEPPQASTLAAGPLGWILEHKDLDLQFTHGAEHAIGEIAKRYSPDRIICPQYSYPGYQRIANQAGATLESYVDSDDLDARLEASPATMKSIVIVTFPGNPINNSIPLHSVTNLPCGAVIIDCTYGRLNGHELQSGAAAATEANIFTVFSLSKAYSLAGFRMGGIVANPKTLSSLKLNHRYWTLSSCAIYTALGDPAISETLDQSFDHLIQLSELIRVILRNMRIEIVGDETPLFTSARTDCDYNLIGKHFSDEVLRIDTCPQNVNRLSELFGSTNNV